LLLRRDEVELRGAFLIKECAFGFVAAAPVFVAAGDEYIFAGPDTLFAAIILVYIGAFLMTTRETSLV
jgi:hypothetical protein